MESIIPLIIMLIVGSLFKSRKNKEPSEEQQPRPQAPRQVQPERSTDPVKKLKERSMEMYRELQQEMQREAEPQHRPATPQPVVIPVRPAVQQPRPSIQELPKEHTRSTRISRNRRQTSRGQSTIEKKDISLSQSFDRTNLLPKSEEDLIKGVIFSEIFGPPKSKR